MITTTTTTTTTTPLAQQCQNDADCQTNANCFLDQTSTGDSISGHEASLQIKIRLHIAENGCNMPIIEKCLEYQNSYLRRKGCLSFVVCFDEQGFFLFEHTYNGSNKR